MSEPTARPSEPSRRFNWRRLFQFRLRTLLVLTTIIAIALGWWSHKARRQREALEAFWELGGGSTYDVSLPWTGGKQDPPKWPQWLLDNIDEDYLAGVDFLTLEDTRVTDADLQHLENLTALQELILDNTQTTDAGLQHIKGLTTLQEISLRNTTVSDAGLECLSALKALDILVVRDTQVTKAGVARLQEALPNCTIIH